MAPPETTPISEFATAPLTLAELREKQATLARQQAELEKQIANELQAARAGVVAKIKAMMAENALTLGDLEDRPRASTKRERAPGEEVRKVAPKYMNVATGESWSGRGLKPKWLAAALEAGRSLDEFLINTSAAA